MMVVTVETVLTVMVVVTAETVMTFKTAMTAKTAVTVVTVETVLTVVTDAVELKVTIHLINIAISYQVAAVPIPPASVVQELVMALGVGALGLQLPYACLGVTIFSLPSQ